MKNGEPRPKNPVSPEQRMMAEQFRKEFDRLQKLAREATTDYDRVRANGACSTLVHHSLYDHLPFLLWVDVPPSFRSERSVGWKVVEEDIRNFKTAQLCAMGFGKDGFQVDFCDDKAEPKEKDWLSVYGCHEIMVSPIFTDEVIPLNDGLLTVFEEKSAEMGFAPIYVEDEPGKVYQPHSHHEVHLFGLGGSMSLRVGDETIEMIRGIEVHIDEGIEHEAAVGPEGARYIFAHPEGIEPFSYKE